MPLFSKGRWVKCPDGPHYVYHRVDDAFPLAARNTLRQTQAEVKGLEGVTARAGHQVKDTVADLLVLVREENGSVQLDYRANYAVYQADPCNQVEYLKQGTLRVQNAQERYRRAALLCRTLLQKASGLSDANLLAALRELKDTLILPTGAQLATESLAEVERAPKRIDGWREPA
jgi:hypothetical protein